MATVTRIDLANTLKQRFGLTTVDSYKMIAYAIDMKPLLKDPQLSVKEFALSFVDDLRNEISEVLGE